MDHIVVANKSVAKVYVKSSPSSTDQPNNEIGQGNRAKGNVGDDEIIQQGPIDGNHARGNTSQYKYYFKIESVDSFEKELDEAQEALGIDPHNYIPVTYDSQMNWFQVIMNFALMIFVLLGYVWCVGRKMPGGFGVGGPGGKGGRSIFNIGKAHVTKMDKNAKNKVIDIVMYLNFNHIYAS